MAKKPSNAFAIDPDKRYRLTVNRVTPRGRTTFRPANSYEVKGAVALDLGDAVAEIELLEE
ncbi:hypothetical protein [Kaistia sp. MMO-174]|uniref:hypothetical protein n=1 Tax=Kaistia sp. MMO-174 TaxID=3081256 RepID=UPI003016701D